MSDCPPPGAAADAAVHRAEALTPESIERILTEFRAWLAELARAGAVSPGQPVRDEELEPIDLFTLLGQMTALRHEVHLQTRAVRAQQEQNAQTLEQLGAALEALREAPSAAAEDGSDEDERLRPLLKTLVDLYDALALAAREVQRVQETLRAPPEPDAGLAQAAPDPSTNRAQALMEEARELRAASAQAHERAAASAGFLARWFGVDRAKHQARVAECDAMIAETKLLLTLREATVAQQLPDTSARAVLAERIRQMIDSVITGYTMSLQRLERALRQHELEPIPCVGQPFDPERMEVLEVAANTGRPSGEVVEEVRRGYLWRGRVFRYAQVRVARS